MTNKPAVIVTGGAGYIGSHAVLAFREAAYPVVVVDDLSTGHRESVPKDVPFIEGDAGDEDLVGRVIRDHGVGAVVHFAGSIVIPESVADPLKYYRNNTAASRNLIEACVANHVRDFIFSSTAAHTKTTTRSSSTTGNWWRFTMRRSRPRPERLGRRARCMHDGKNPPS